MKTIKCDDQLILETMSECNEQLDKTIQLLIEVEKHAMPFNIEIYNEIFRTLHSIKGCISMVGLTTESEIVHNCESLFKQCSIDEKFYPGIIQVTIEFLNHLSDFFSGNKNSYFELLKIKNCFECVIKQNFLATCPGHGQKNEQEESKCSSDIITEVELIKDINKSLTNIQNSERACSYSPSTIEKVMLIGNNPDVEAHLNLKKIPFTQVSDLEQAYLFGKRLMLVDTFLLDITNCGGHCMSFVLAINSIAPIKKILLLSNREIPNFNEMLVPEKMSFMFTGTASRNFIGTLNYIINAS